MDVGSFQSLRFVFSNLNFTVWSFSPTAFFDPSSTTLMDAWHTETLSTWFWRENNNHNQIGTHQRSNDNKTQPRVHIESSFVEKKAIMPQQKQQKQQQQLTGIITPQELDILCVGPASSSSSSTRNAGSSSSSITGGGGGGSGAVVGLRHRGNQVYREMVHRNRELYYNNSSSEPDEQCTNISKSIVGAIRKRHGRFLQRDDTTNTWFDIGDPQAIENTTRT
jgi:hypothetical protein